MDGNRYYPHMRKRYESFSRYKFMLQSVVSAFVLDYRGYISSGFVCDCCHVRRGRKLIMADGTIHIGVRLAGRVTWDVTYLGLKVNEKLEIDFYIRTGYLVSHHGNIPVIHEELFRCTVRAVGEQLAFELAKQDGVLIRRFWFDRPIVKGVFYPVVCEIRKHLHPGGI